MLRVSPKLRIAFFVKSRIYLMKSISVYQISIDSFFMIENIVTNPTVVPLLALVPAEGHVGAVPHSIPRVGKK